MNNLLVCRLIYGIHVNTIVTYFSRGRRWWYPIWARGDWSVIVRHATTRGRWWWCIAHGRGRLKLAFSAAVIRHVVCTSHIPNRDFQMNQQNPSVIPTSIHYFVFSCWFPAGPSVHRSILIQKEAVVYMELIRYYLFTWKLPKQKNDE